MDWTSYDVGPGAVVERVVVGFAGANCYILGCTGTREAAVIDPGTTDPDETEAIVDEIRYLGLTVRYIVNTHGHPDHMSGNDALKSAVGGEVAIHELDAPKLTDPYLNGSLMFGLDVQVSPADRLLKDGEVLEIGDLALKVIHTPGHSVGGIALLGDGYVFTGDTLFAGSIGRSDLPDSSADGTIAYDVLLASIRGRLLTLPDRTLVLPGHGPVTTIGEEKATNPFVT